MQFHNYYKYAETSEFLSWAYMYKHSIVLGKERERESSELREGKSQTEMRERERERERGSSELHGDREEESQTERREREREGGSRRNEQREKGAREGKSRTNQGEGDKSGVCVCAFPAGAALGGDCRSVELAVFSLAPRIEYGSEYDQTTTISLPPRTDGREEMRASVWSREGWLYSLGSLHRSSPAADRSSSLSSQQLKS